MKYETNYKTVEEQKVNIQDKNKILNKKGNDNFEHSNSKNK